MAVINCLCGERLEGADDETLFLALRRHLGEAHAEWALDDQQVRDVLAARQRLTPWDGETRPLEGPLEVRALGPETLDDYLRFFDRDAFMDNPAWAQCYCLFYDFAGSGEEFERRTGADNRRDKAALISSGRAKGLLAYAGGRVVGWCHAAPRSLLPGLDRQGLRGEEGEPVGAIVCFVIAAPYRRQGIAGRLLDAACDYLRQQGMAAVESYPLAEESPSEARAYHGPLSMYLRAGFQVVREVGPFAVVRKELAAG